MPPVTRAPARTRPERRAAAPDGPPPEVPAPGGPGRGRRRRGPDGADRPKRRNVLWRWRRILFLIGLLAFTALAGVLYLLSRVPLPAVTPPSQNSYIYDANGNQLAALQGDENRTLITLDKVPKVVIDAVLSTEDRNFYHHGAIDPVGLLRAAISDLRGRGNLQGGSSITQQYVKITYTGGKRNLVRKIKEAALAIKLQRQLTKNQILERYLNTIYFGRGAYGVQAASLAYFNKDVSQLGLPEATYLAGLIRSPETDDPYRGYEPTAVARRTLTLRAMVRDHQISDADMARVSALPVTSYVLKPAATRLTASDSANGTQYFVDYVRQALINQYGADAVLGQGLRVTTTLDLKMQDQAFAAVYGGPTGLQPYRAANPEPAGALVSIDDKGQVKAMVGGQDYTRSQVNLALGTAGGGTGRQAGSTFKPFLLAETIREGYSVNTTFPAPPKIDLKGQGPGGKPYEVNNFNNEDGGASVSLIDATANSLNTVYAQLEMAIGPTHLVDMAKQLGINAGELAPNASLVLGTAQVSVLEMAAAYNTFSDGGTYIPPRVITKVTKADGTPLTWTNLPARQVLTRTQAAVLTYCLQQVVLRGTGGSAAISHQPIAGKTGTTSSYSDAWFIGYTPHLTAAVWMGYPSGSKPMADGVVRGIKPGIEGGSIPAQIFSRFMSSAVTDGPYTGQFDVVNRILGTIVPAPTNVSIPTTSTSSTTSTTSTTVATTTTKPGTPTTPPPAATTTPPRTAPPTSHPPPTTVPPTT